MIGLGRIRAQFNGPPHGLIQLLKVGAGIPVVLYAVIEGAVLLTPLIVDGDDLGQRLIQFLHRQHIGPGLAVFILKGTFDLIQVADDRQGRRHVLIEILG